MSTSVILLVLGLVVFYGSSFLEMVLGGTSYLVMLLVIVAAYFALVKLSATYPDLAEDETSH